MLTIITGQRIPVSSISNASALRLTFDIKSPLNLDLACFGLDAQGKLSDDRYTVFYNQIQSPAREIQLIGQCAFEVNLQVLPATIDKLVFTAAIDGNGTMRQLGHSRFFIQQDAFGAFSGADFAAERAVMLVEFYRKNGEWRFASVMQGFNGGLDALVAHFGGEVSQPAASTAAAPAPATAPTSCLSLEKKVAQQAPALLSLAKKAQLTLEKQRLTDLVARVGLALDASGSMDGQYKKGRVQEVVDRLLPLALAFDDDGEIDCWAFAEKPRQLSNVTVRNYSDFISRDSGGWKIWDVGSRYNEEPRAIKKIIDHYRSSGDRTPAYVLFISDGGVHPESNRPITKLITEAASLPIFWQFVGIGGQDYGVLERLDTMTGRVVDNCNFFALDDLRSVSEQELYDRLMAEFPSWLKEAKAKGIIN